MVDSRMKPLMKAVENSGSLPNWLFSHPIIAGFFALIMCSVFGGVSLMFWSSTSGQLSSEAYLSVFTLGGIGGIAVGTVTLLFIFATAFLERDEAQYRMLFCLGGVLGIAVFFIILYMISASAGPEFSPGSGLTG